MIHPKQCRSQKPHPEHVWSRPNSRIALMCPGKGVWRTRALEREIR